MKRGQAALEYLMNYWWAFLIIIIIGVLVWRFLLGGVPTTPTQLPFQITEVPVTALSVYDNGTAFVTIENRRGDVIKFKYFSISIPGCNMTKATDEGIDIPRGSFYTFIANSTECSGITAGMSVDANFTMRYEYQNVPYTPTDRKTVQIQPSGT